MNKETILDYATRTPENTNRNVLGSMLDQFAKGGSGGANAVTLYLVDKATTDPHTAAYGESVTWVNESQNGLSLENGGNPLTYDELRTLFDQKPYIVVEQDSDGVKSYCLAMNFFYGEEDEMDKRFAAIVLINSMGEGINAGLDFVGTPVK